MTEFIILYSKIINFDLILKCIVSIYQVYNFSDINYIIIVIIIITMKHKMIQKWLCDLKFIYFLLF
jgi:hypothetical protein